MSLNFSSLPLSRQESFQVPPSLINHNEILSFSSGTWTSKNNRLSAAKNGSGYISTPASAPSTSEAGPSANGQISPPIHKGGVGDVRCSVGLVLTAVLGALLVI